MTVMMLIALWQGRLRRQGSSARVSSLKKGGDGPDSPVAVLTGSIVVVVYGRGFGEQQETG